VDYSGVTDLAGNLGTGLVSSSNYAVDTLRPDLAADISISDTALKGGDTATVTFTFSESVTWTTPGIAVANNGTLSNLTTIDGGTTWTATLTPKYEVTADGNRVSISLQGVQDLAGNKGADRVVESLSSFAVDTEAPGLAIMPTVSDDQLSIGEHATISFVFHEPVSGFDTDDILVSHSTVSDLVSSDGGTTWTARLTPFENTEVTKSPLVINYAGITDLAGNAGSGEFFWEASPALLVSPKPRSNRETPL
jgi:hypothetical protein